MGRFRPLRMTIRGEQMGSYLGDMLRVWELAVLYYDTSSPLEKGHAKGAGWIHEAVGRLCEITRLPPVIPTEVEGALLYGGGFAAFLEDGNLASQPSPLGEGAP